MKNYLSKNSVSPLNDKHGYFQSADAQGDVSVAFANDAVLAFINLGKESSEAFSELGLSPRQMADEILALRAAVSAALPYVSQAADASGLMDERNLERELLDLLK